MLSKKNAEKTESLQQVSTQVTIEGGQSLLEKMQQFVTFVVKAQTHLTHGKQTTSFLLTQHLP